MTTRIYKTEKYIPRNGGNPVFQVLEEADLGNGRIIQLDPRNPTAEELTDADDLFALAQQTKIAKLDATIAAMIATRDELAASVEAEKATLIAEHATAINALTTEHTSAAEAATQNYNAALSVLTAERDAALAQVEPLQAEIEALQAVLNPSTATTITRRQGQLALLGAGLLDAVEAAVAQGGKVAQISYESATWMRTDEVLNQLAGALGLSDEQLDELFLTASKL